MKVLVTGGSGYIGSHTLIELLEDGGFEVVSIDNYLRSTPKTYSRIEEITGKKVNHYEVDLCDLEATRSVFKKEKDITGIIHFAALKMVGESVEKPLLYYQNNNQSLLSILTCMQEFGIDNLIFSSSCSVYGNVNQLPVNEQTPLSKAECPYAHTKQMGEEIIEHYLKVHNQKAIALRYFNPVGAHKSGMNGEYPIGKPNNLVPVITQTAIGKMEKMFVHGTDYPTRDGSCIRDYIHVTDIANAHVRALKYLQAISSDKHFEILNLGTGNGVSVLEAIKAFEKVSGTKLNYELGSRRPGDVASIYSDSSLAEAKLGWKPKFSIEEMMNSAWKWEQNLQKENE